MHWKNPNRSSNQRNDKTNEGNNNVKIHSRTVPLSTHSPQNKMNKNERKKKNKKTSGKEIKITDTRRKEKFVSSFTFGLWLLHHFVNSTSKETRSDKSSARQTVLVKRLAASAAAATSTHMPNDRENKRDAKSKDENEKRKEKMPDYVEEIDKEREGEREDGIFHHLQQTSSYESWFAASHIRGAAREEGKKTICANWNRDLLIYCSFASAEVRRMHPFDWHFKPSGVIHFFHSLRSFLFHLAGEFRDSWSMYARARGDGGAAVLAQTRNETQ